MSVLHQTGSEFREEFWGSLRLSLLISLLATAVQGGFETMEAKLHSSEVQLKTKELERERALKPPGSSACVAGVPDPSTFSFQHHQLGLFADTRRSGTRRAAAHANGRAA